MKIAKEDQQKPTFATKWGSFVYIVIPFGLKNAPSLLSRIVVVAFRDFIHKFIQTYLDEWIVFSLLKKHI